jgi:hypothetical protein
MVYFPVLNRFIMGALMVCCAVLLFACFQEDVVVGAERSISYPSSVHKISLNSAGYGVARLENLAGNDVYLAKVNVTRVRYNTNIAAGDFATGNSHDGEGSRDPAGIVILDNGETLIRYERHWQITLPAENALTVNRNLASSFAAAKVGDTKSFYVDVSPQQKSATLKHIGTYCKVWVAEDAGSDVNSKITGLADKFDAIYPLETKLLGYENGAGGNGGADGDPKIQILIYDIADYGNGTTYGYFYPGDEFQRGSTYPYSNEAEIFYIDSVSLDSNPKAIYSTLIHEFNHMINFNIKVLGGGQITSWNNEVWYTEMLSMLAEDVIGPLVEIPYDSSSDNGHVINARIPMWLAGYADYGVMQWDNSNPLPYYASNYAFGAYLVRNFGGPALLSAIAKSYAGGRGSVDGSLRALNGWAVDTVYAMHRFGEALVYFGEAMPKDVCSFYKTVTETIGGTDYMFPRFNIGEEIVGEIISLTGHGVRGVRPFEKLTDYSSPPNSVQLYSDSTWKNKRGTLDVFLRNVDANASYYLLVK